MNNSLLPDPVDGAMHFRASDDVLIRTAGTETVLLDLGSEEFFGLDGVGARVFELLAETRTLDQVVDILLLEYDVERDVLLGDVGDLLAELLQRGLVVSQ